MRDLQRDRPLASLKSVVEFFSRLTWYFLIIIGVCINFTGFTSELCLLQKFLTDLLPTLTGETQEATYDFTFLTD